MVGDDSNYYNLLIVLLNTSLLKGKSMQRPYHEIANYARNFDINCMGKWVPHLDTRCAVLLFHKKKLTVNLYFKYEILA